MASDRAHREGGAKSRDGCPSPSTEARSEGRVWLEDLEVGSEQLAVLSYDAVPPVRLGELTRAEREVVRGVLDGLSNRQIADQRDCSPATIGNHLAAIYAKLGLSSRWELVCALLGDTRLDVSG